MSLLTDDEIDAAWARSPQNNLRDYAKEIEAAVIRKLAAVSLSHDDLRGRLGEIEESLIAAWNAAGGTT